jgi:hypothetical protein
MFKVWKRRTLTETLKLLTLQMVRILIIFIRDLDKGDDDSGICIAIRYVLDKYSWRWYNLDIGVSENLNNSVV